MELTDWSYGRKYQIKAWFDSHPHSPVIFRSFPNFHFVYMVKWSEQDPTVTRQDLQEMERLMNEELGSLRGYESRRSVTKQAYVK
ncbi:hypothetical protein CR194_09905 [Salipaludibacillus keqinensis]|uniref:Uncharacterized protein n=1 Tax=Salipaludibacillus keqinensis TaxID=2045207 RepID=A0A323TVD9_9BACI|nr:hypothetical protein [Salipaludibacillus keqinensis]PYZ93475.1 hypothetical protein CR194_09905 [Salipaludibacillus keqinensis]